MVLPRFKVFALEYVLVKQNFPSLDSGPARSDSATTRGPYILYATTSLRKDYAFGLFYFLALRLYSCIPKPAVRSCGRRIKDISVCREPIAILGYKKSTAVLRPCYCTALNKESTAVLLPLLQYGAGQRGYSSAMTVTAARRWTKRVWQCYAFRYSMSYTVSVTSLCAHWQWEWRHELVQDNLWKRDEL